MKVSKKALRFLPVILLFEILTQVLTIAFVGFSAGIAEPFGTTAATVTILTLSIALLAVWITGSAFVYGIMELSRQFRYSWYLHIAYFVIKVVALVFDSISAIMGGDVTTGNEGIFGTVEEILSVMRQFVGMAALCLAMLGFKAVMDKLGKSEISASCHKYAYFFLIIGIVSALNDSASLIMTLLSDNADGSLNMIYTVILAIFFIINVLTATISIPAFLTVRKACRTVFDKLQSAQEV